MSPSLFPRESWRRATLLASVVFAGTALALLGRVPYGRAGGEARLLPQVFLASQPLPIGPECEAMALAIVRRYAKTSLTIALPRGETVETRQFSRAAFGLEIDKQRLASLLREVRDPMSAMRRHAQVGAPLVLPIPVLLRREVALGALLKWKDDVDRPPLDARFDLEARRPVAEQAGFFLDVYGTLAQLEGAMVSGENRITAAYDRKLPRLVATQIEHVAFGEVLGWFETRYVADKKHEARTYNLKLAATRLDGHVILPGEIFDFNDVVGPRDEANGYKVAPVIAQGELVDGIGGGTCQIAGTLHGAGFFAGLDIVERHPHTRPSFYIKMGLDATVVYPTITLRLRNSFDHPVVLHETVRGGLVRAEILGPKRSRTVSFIRKIDEILPFAEIERPDPKLPKGTTVLSQRGIPGFRTHRYRVVREGAFAVRERYNESYPPTSQIVRVGTGDGGDDQGVEDDDHPEYVADEYLVLLQGADIKGAMGAVPSAGSKEGEGGGMVELREPGRSGEHGWTERAGFSHYVSMRRPKNDDDRCVGDCPTEVAPHKWASKGAPGDRAKRPVAERRPKRVRRRP